MQRKSVAVAVSVGVVAAVLAACAGTPDRRLPPLALVADVDLARYMGDWYVIAAIPTVFERDVHNPKENYVLGADGSIATIFTFNEGAFDGTSRRITSTASVVAGSGNAVWQQQYLWLLKADYRISYLAADYSQVVVTREKRDYAWIMARTPTIAAADLDRLTAFVAAQGYDMSGLRRMPQAASR